MYNYFFFIYSCKKNIKKASLIYDILHNRLPDCKIYIIYGNPDASRYEIKDDKYLILNNNMKFTCTVLDAMCRLTKSWKDVKESTIVKCFTKANFNPQDDPIPRIIE